MVGRLLKIAVVPKRTDVAAAADAAVADVSGVMPSATFVQIFWHCG